MADVRDIPMKGDGGEPTAEEEHLEALLAHMPRHPCPERVRTNVMAALRAQRAEQPTGADARSAEVVTLWFRRRLRRTLQVAAVLAVAVVSVKVYFEVRDRARFDPMELARSAGDASVRAVSPAAGPEAFERRKDYEGDRDRTVEASKSALDAVASDDAVKKEEPSAADAFALEQDAGSPRAARRPESMRLPAESRRSVASRQVPTPASGEQLAAPPVSAPQPPVTLEATTAPRERRPEAEPGAGDRVVKAKSSGVKKRVEQISSLSDGTMGEQPDVPPAQEMAQARPAVDEPLGGVGGQVVSEDLEASQQSRRRAVVDLAPVPPEGVQGPPAVGTRVEERERRVGAGGRLTAPDTKDTVAFDTVRDEAGGTPHMAAEGTSVAEQAVFAFGAERFGDLRNGRATDFSLADLQCLEIVSSPPVPQAAPALDAGFTLERRWKGLGTAQEREVPTAWGEFRSNVAAAFNGLLESYDGRVRASQDVVVMPGERPAILLVCTVPDANGAALVESVNGKRIVVVPASTSVDLFADRRGARGFPGGETSATRTEPETVWRARGRAPFAKISRGELAKANLSAVADFVVHLAPEGTRLETGLVTSLRGVQQQGLGRWQFTSPTHLRLHYVPAATSPSISSVYAGTVLRDGWATATDAPETTRELLFVLEPAE